MVILHGTYIFRSSKLKNIIFFKTIPQHIDPNFKLTNQIETDILFLRLKNPIYRKFF